jgi:hypothetical protein
LAGKSNDDETTYHAFLNNATVLWDELCANFENKLNLNLTQVVALQSRNIEPYWEATTEITARKQKADMDDLTQFFCIWALNKPIVPAVRDPLFTFYSAIHDAVLKLSPENSARLLQCLKNNVENRNIYTMRYKHLEAVLSVYSTSNSMSYLSALSRCFNQVNQPLAIEAFVKIMPVLIKHDVPTEGVSIFIDRLLTLMNTHTTISSYALNNLSKLLDEKSLAKSFVEHVDARQLEEFMHLLSQSDSYGFHHESSIPKVSELLKNATSSCIPDRLKKTPMYLYLAQ